MTDTRGCIVHGDDLHTDHVHSIVVGYLIDAENAGREGRRDDLDDVATCLLADLEVALDLDAGSDQ